MNAGAGQSRTRERVPTYVTGMTDSAYMSPTRALPILQELASCVRRSELIGAMLDLPSELIEEALATACKEMYVQIIVPRRPRD